MVLFSIKNSLENATENLSLLAVLIFPCAVRNAHLHPWLRGCTVAYGPLSGICFSVKSDLIATGSLHLWYLKLFKDQASCPGEPKKAAICLFRRWASKHFPVISHPCPVSWVGVGASKCSKEALLSHEGQKRERRLGMAGSCPSPRLCQQFKFYNFVLQVSVYDARPRLVSSNSSRLQVFHNCTCPAKSWRAVMVKNLPEVVP